VYIVVVSDVSVDISLYNVNTSAILISLILQFRRRASRLQRGLAGRAIFELLHRINMICSSL
jgi:hypothetical protein